MNVIGCREPWGYHEVGMEWNDRTNGREVSSETHRCRRLDGFDAAAFVDDGGKERCSQIALEDVGVKRVAGP
jgi:hypothetical protein